MDNGIGSTTFRSGQPESALHINDYVFDTRHGVKCQYQDSVLTMISEPGSDGFNIPGLHVVDRLGTLLTPILGEFALGADVRLFSQAKFDAAGLFIEAGHHWLKFGIEEYGTSKKIVSVHSSPYSDEVNGIDVMDTPIRLFISRSADVFSCYLEDRDGKVVFHRTFYVSDCPAEVRVGFCVQSPFSGGAQGQFTRIAMLPQSMGHIRE